MKLFIKKTYIVFFFALCIYHLPGYAQKFGYVDTDFVLSRMPEFSGAQAEIQKVAIAWEEEIKDKHKKIDGMYSTLKAEEVLLTKEMYQERLEEIQAKEDSLKQYQKKVFGFEGLYFLKKKELMKPIQDKVFEAVEKVARKQRLQIVFDKSGDLVMIYTDPRHDYTDFVLEELGLGEEDDSAR